MEIKAFSLINGIVLTLLALLCILPLVNVLAISLSSNTAVTAGKVMFLPVDFTLKSYEYVAKEKRFGEQWVLHWRGVYWV